MKTVQIYHKDAPNVVLTLRWQLNGPDINPKPSDNPLSAIIWVWLDKQFACADEHHYQLTQWQNAKANEESFWNAIRTLQRFGFNQVNNFV